MDDSAPLATVAAVFVAWFFAVIAGDRLIRSVIDLAWMRIGEQKDAPWLTTLLGTVERSLYFAAYLLGTLEFVAVWLAFKVAVRWARWEEKPDPNAGNGSNLANKGRNLYNAFLIGNGLSVAYGITGAAALGWWLQGLWLPAMGVPFTLFVLTLLMRHYISRQAPTSKDTPDVGTQTKPDRPWLLDASFVAFALLIGYSVGSEYPSRIGVWVAQSEAATQAFLYPALWQQVDWAASLWSLGGTIAAVVLGGVITIAVTLWVEDKRRPKLELRLADHSDEHYPGTEREQWPAKEVRWVNLRLNSPASSLLHGWPVE
ncbi:MAG: hypothetical protein ACYC1C_00960 [Chloroflexota bacterium]